MIDNIICFLSNFHLFLANNNPKNNLKIDDGRLFNLGFLHCQKGKSAKRHKFRTECFGNEPLLPVRRFLPS